MIFERGYTYKPKEDKKGDQDLQSEKIVFEH